MRQHLLTIALLAGSLACVCADEQTSKHRLIGLSTAERLDDLQATMKELTDIKLVSLDAENAEVTLGYDLKALFPNQNPKKSPTPEEINKRLEELLRTASHGTFTLKPPSTVPKDKLTKVDIKVGILDCKACRYAAYIAVANLEGVERATVDAKTSTVTAWVDASKTKREDLEAALKKARVDLITDG